MSEVGSVGKYTQDMVINTHDTPMSWLFVALIFYTPAGFLVVASLRNFLKNLFEKKIKLKFIC